MLINFPSENGGVVTLEAPSTKNTYTLLLPDIPTSDGSFLTSNPGSVKDEIVRTNAVTADKIANTAVTPDKLERPLTRPTEVSRLGLPYVDFNDIPSWAKRITLSFSNVSSAGVGTGSLSFKIGDNVNGIANTGYISTGAYIDTTGAVDSGNSTGAFVFTGGTGNTALRTGQVEFNNLTGNTWTVFGSHVSITNGNMFYVVGSKTLDAELSRIRIIYTGTDTPDDGRFNIIYQ